MTNENHKRIIRPIFFENELNGNAKKSFNNFCNEIGQYYYTNTGARMQIVDYLGNKKVKYQFDNGYTGWAHLRFIKAGKIWDPFEINIYGGYFGVGPYNQKNDKSIYNSWLNILARVGGPNHSVQSYTNVSVCEEWRCFQNFAEWYTMNLKQLNTNNDIIYSVDKDIFQWNQEYKVYGPNTCCLIPIYLNKILENLHSKPNRFGLPVGVEQAPNGRYRAEMITYDGGYKSHPLGVYNTVEEAFNAYAIAKKNRILMIASEYYSQGCILPNVYEALKNLELKPNI